MKAVEHYDAAEAVLRLLASEETHGLHGDDRAAMIGIAQVHATLALAGATALQAYSRGDEPELDEWQAAAGGAG